MDAIKKQFPSVCKLFVVKCSPNYAQPWTVKSSKNSTSSAFIVREQGNLRLVTNAHCVEDAASILVRRHGESERFEAKVLSIAHQCDIALLSVADDAFWKDTTPLELEMSPPHLSTKAVVVGYPTGGDQLSITAGVVSRVGVRSYVNRYWALLAIQIDSPINAGNSGGPVFDEAGKVVGVAFSHITTAQNIGYIVPSMVVARCLDDWRVRASPTIILADIGVEVMNLENQSLRTFHGLEKHVQGVLVARLAPLGCAKAAGVRIGDVLFEIDGAPVANDGTIVFRDDERVSWSHKLDLKMLGEEVTLRVRRRADDDADDAAAAPKTGLGKLTELTLTFCCTYWPALVPRINAFDARPNYLVVGGFVFQTLSVPMMAAVYGRDWGSKSPSSMVLKYMIGKREQPDDEVVVLTTCLASSLTVGYKAGSLGCVVTHFGEAGEAGTRVRSLRHLMALVDEARAQTAVFYRFELEFGSHVVLERAAADEQLPEILARYKIAQASRYDVVDFHELSFNGNGNGGEPPSATSSADGNGNDGKPPSATSSADADEGLRKKPKLASTD